MRRRSVLRLLVASLVINAALGIWALLRDDFGQTEGKIIATSFFVTAAMLVVLVNQPAIRRRIIAPVPTISAGAGASGIALFALAMWISSDQQWVLRLAGTLVLAGGAGTLASVLALLRSRRSVLVLAHAAVAALFITLTYAIWSDDGGDWLARVIGVEGIVVATLTIILAVLARLVQPSEPNGQSNDGLEVRFCPNCGRGVAVDGSTATCSACAAVFRVDFDRELISR